MDIKRMLQLYSKIPLGLLGGGGIGYAVADKDNKLKGTMAGALGGLAPSMIETLLRNKILTNKLAPSMEELLGKKDILSKLKKYTNPEVANAEALSQIEGRYLNKVKTQEDIVNELSKKLDSDRIALQEKYKDVFNANRGSFGFNNPSLRSRAEQFKNKLKPMISKFEKEVGKSKKNIEDINTKYENPSDFITNRAKRLMGMGNSALLKKELPSKLLELSPLFALSSLLAASPYKKQDSTIDKIKSYLPF